MSDKITKQFGVWMDSHQATVVGNSADGKSFFTIGSVSNEGQGSNSNEKTGNNAERSSQQKYFKEISSHMVNAEEIHVTGTGTSQEQFIRYMADTPQFKNTIAKESTSNKMSDENLLEFIAAKFN